MNDAPRLSLNASAASTWTVCTAQPQSLVDNAHRIPPQGTKYSVEGTLAHAAGEAALTGKPFAKGTSKVMKEHALKYAAFCMSLVDEGDAFEVEREVELYYMPGRRGFVDFLTHSATRVKIVDLKYGEGVAVSAKQNKQMAIYARSLVKELIGSADEGLMVEMHIWQPRVRDGERHSSWVLPWDELMQFIDDEIGPAVADILWGQEHALPHPDARRTVFAPSDKTCRFCPLSTFCEARTAWLAADIPELAPILDGDEPNLTDPKGMTDDALAKALDRADDIAKWLNQLEEYAVARALDGNGLPGHKLVLTKGAHRTWRVKDTVVAKKLRPYLDGRTLYTRKFLTPKQAEEALHGVAAPKELIDEISALTVKPMGKPAIAPLDDPRPEYSLFQLSPFTNLDAEDHWI